MHFTRRTSPSRSETRELSQLKAREASDLKTTASHDELPSSEEADPKLERKLLWKLDLLILPLVSGVYFFASLDRSDLANANIAGLNEELQLTPAQYSNAATLFLVSYIIFQLPGTLLIRKIKAPIQFGITMILWGLFTTLEVTIQNAAQLLAMRFLVGACEAFVQGVVFYMSFWYRYSELATRASIFFSMSTLAGAFSGLISYAIVSSLDGTNGWRAWRWIFLIEGVLPIAFSFLVFLLPSSPTEIRFGFSEPEKQRAIQRSVEAHNTSEAHLQFRKIPKVLLSLHFWLFAINYCAIHFCISSLSNFLPAIIEDFGYDAVNSQLFSVIVYASASFGIIFWARVADLTNQRSLTVAASMVGAVAGYSILIASTSRGARFAATNLVAFSVYPGISLQLSWMAMSFVGYTRRGSTLAFMNIFSQVFAISGNQAYRDPPYYRAGNAASLGMSVLVVVTALILRWYLGHLNGRKKEMPSEQVARLRLESLEEIGDKHPDFVYTL